MPLNRWTPDGRSLGRSPPHPKWSDIDMMGHMCSYGMHVSLCCTRNLSTEMLKDRSISIRSHKERTSQRGHRLGMSCHFLKCRFLSWRPISSVQHLASGLWFPLLLKFKGISASKFARYWYHLISLDIRYHLYISVSATCFASNIDKWGVQLSGGKPMPRRVIQRGEFTAAKSGLENGRCVTCCQWLQNPESKSS